MRTIVPNDIRAALLAEGVNLNVVNIFLEWHRLTPSIWKEFEKVALEAIACGYKHWGAKGIAEIVRWNLSKASGREYKLNNNYVAYYARVFALKYPEHKEFFEFREVKGLKDAA